MGNWVFATVCVLCVSRYGQIGLSDHGPFGVRTLALGSAGAFYSGGMCRNIKVLHNFEPPATEPEVEAAATQYVRKVAGMTKPSAGNQQAFDTAVAAVEAATQVLLEALVTQAPKRDREIEIAKARARNEKRFGAPAGR